MKLLRCNPSKQAYVVQSVWKAIVARVGVAESSPIVVVRSHQRI